MTSTPKSEKLSSGTTAILDYLSDADPEMYEFIDTLSLSHLLNARGKIGLTFLNPRIEKWREGVRVAIEQENADALEKIANEISACIIEDVFKHPMEFKNKYDDIPNS